MVEPSTRHSRSLRFAVVIGLVVLTAGCGRSPHTAPGTLAAAKTNVLALVNATGAAVGTDVSYTPQRTADDLPCKKKVFGYSVGSAGTDRAEVPVTIAVKGTRDGASLLPAIERYWRGRGYTIDRSGMGDTQFPKLRAHAGADDLLVATGYVGLPQLNLYGVSGCVRP